MQDNILSALIGLVRACESNPKTEHTNAVVLAALSFLQLHPNYEENDIQKIVAEIHAEKNAVAPGCAQCTSPCGNTSDYDMTQFYEAEEEIQKHKLALLSELQAKATKLCQFPSDHPLELRFFYRVLSYIGSERDQEELKTILEEAKQTL